MRPIVHHPNLQYVWGALLNLAVYAAVRLFQSGQIGSTSWFLGMIGPVVPIAFPFVLLSLKRQALALGALVAGAILFFGQLILNE
ncbi:MAG: hypothetical protein HYZ09_02895 [Candidatus Kerfeldbacteria bacterium]|nr:hypothetical protein [Candidatus Kerfeldbacteria bacterium]